MYDEEIARSLTEIVDRLKTNQTSVVPQQNQRLISQVPQKDTFGISDGTIVKVGIIFAFLLFGYMIIKSGDNYREMRYNNR